ncbi:MAG: helix-turn-helix domain-containing protein [Bradyrhizobiaceae bacterium]|nr:helix-turn-helix domain-containing protein [Bradyrhizobiaceae bacterium]
MGRPLENRSLDRGLQILNSLSVNGASSLQDLHAHTRLPKSTIRRLLGTLIRHKIVRRSLSDRLYRANISLPMQTKRGSALREGQLIDCALPHMIEMTRSIGWSCDLHLFQRTRSRVVESTRPLSPFFQYERQIDLQVPVFASAAGLAVLSTWPESAVLALVDEIGDDPQWGLSRLGMTKRSLLSVLKQVRANGYSMRVPEYRGQSALANALNAIARPVFRGESAIGALVLLWPKGYLAHDRFAGLHLHRLQEAAAAISADLTQLDQG